MHADDKIVVLDYGHLKEHGSGAELIDMEDGARLTKHTHLHKDTHLQQNTQPTKKNLHTSTYAGYPCWRDGRASGPFFE